MSYAARVTLEEGWWMIAIPQLRGLTQARWLVEAELMAQEYVALALGIPRTAVVITLVVDEQIDPARAS
ncbi:hypothetical protein VD659_15130 [Herbiconiux sp. 11R-BC]|uniref:hypothetical protein n=1 Tax=Herbiconiux sp. 11R-BC TaxID=3111637 RepID=UPI003C06FC3E